MDPHPTRVEATDHKDGTYPYWYCKNCKRYFEDENGNTEYSNQGWIIPKDHTVTHYDEIDSTCTEYGNKEYWECQECQKYYKDLKLPTLKIPSEP